MEAMKIQRLPRLIETAPRLCLIALALALASLWLGGGSAFAEPRTWQLGDGEWVTAEFLTMANQQVTLLRESDHSRVTYPLDQLGREDRKWLEGRASTRSEPLEPARLAALVRIPDDAEGIISLPLRVYLVNGVEMRKDGVSMRTWITPKEVEETLIPEINRIWRVAGIQWTLECVIDQPVAEIPDQREAIAYVQNSSRQADGEIGRKRVTTIQDLSGIKDRHPVVHNLYLFPFLGSTYQGFATVSGNTAFLGTWTNKPSRGKKPPQRCLLV